MTTNQNDQVIEVLARSKDPSSWDMLDQGRVFRHGDLIQNTLIQARKDINGLLAAGYKITTKDEEEKPNIVEYELLRNVTDEQRAQAGDSPLWLRGDIIAILINEGDAYLGHLQELPARPQDKGEEDNGRSD